MRVFDVSQKCFFDQMDDPPERGLTKDVQKLPVKFGVKTHLIPGVI